MFSLVNSVVKQEVRRTVQQTAENVPPTQRVSVSIHASDPISRAGVLSQLRQYPEIVLARTTPGRTAARSPCSSRAPWTTRS
ncbi:hypothetical protein [Streptomyces typhae]|uniref:hypothetical protein n=1 Tax=Streptomyces typhae TaxID=2681492 RepID=UPI003CCD5456